MSKAIILLLTVLACINANLHQTADNPLILEFLQDYKLAMNDLENLIKNNISHIGLENVKTSYVEFTNITSSRITYSGLSKNVSQYLMYMTFSLNALEAIMVNDSFDASFTFNASVVHSIAGKSLCNCTTQIHKININYTKKVTLETGSSKLSNYTYDFLDKNAATNCHVYKGNKLTDKEIVRVNEGVTAQEGSSVFVQFKKVMANAIDQMNKNAATEHLSQIYEVNPYNYDYYGFKIAIGVDTLSAVSKGTTGIINQISGVIADTHFKVQTVPEFKQGYHTFYSLSFLRNFMQYNFKHYGNWSNIMLNRQTIRDLRYFKCRLLDLQEIIPNALLDNSAYVMSQVEFNCGIKSLNDTTLFMLSGKSYMRQNIAWRCKGYLRDNANILVIGISFSNGCRYQFQQWLQVYVLIKYCVDFEPKISHVIQILVSGNSLFTRVDELQFYDETTFNAIDGKDYPVKDKTLANYFISAVDYQFRTYTIGSFFQIKKGSSEVLAVEGEGIWIK